MHTLLRAKYWNIYPHQTNEVPDLPSPLATSYDLWTNPAHTQRIVITICMYSGSLKQYVPLYIDIESLKICDLISSNPSN